VNGKKKEGTPKIKENMTVRLVLFTLSVTTKLARIINVWKILKIV
jgi:hypothetical protein